MHHSFAAITKYCHFPQRPALPQIARIAPVITARRPAADNPFYAGPASPARNPNYSGIFRLPPIAITLPAAASAPQFLYDTPMTPIGKGGQGRIFRVKATDGRHYAFKAFEGSRAERHMEREARANLKLPDSSLFPKYHGKATIGTSKGLLFEYIDGTTLDLFMRGLRRDAAAGRCSLETMERQIENMIERLLAACRLMHKNSVTHGDLKPRNIILDRHGRLKLCDLGLATVHDFPCPASPALVVSNAGTPGFMPVEASRVPPGCEKDMLGGKTAEEIGQAGDVFAAGCMIYTLLQEVRRLYSVLLVKRNSPPPSPLPFDPAANNPREFFNSVQAALQRVKGCSDQATPTEQRAAVQHRQDMFRKMRDHSIPKHVADQVLAMTHPLAALRPSAEAVLHQRTFKGALRHSRARTAPVS